MSGSTAAEHARVVVLRDREPAALRNPPESMFGQATVSYQHLPGLDTLPEASHYVFNCDRLTERAYGLALEAAGRGSSVTLILQTLEATHVSLAQHDAVNVIPAYGPAGQITTGTLQKAISAVLARRRVVAHGFIEHSSEPHRAAGSTHPFVNLLAAASEQAKDAPIVAAVLALQRSGSKFLRDMIGLTTSGQVKVFHEHEVPDAPDPTLVDPHRPLFDQLILEPDRQRRQAIRKALLRDALMTPKTRYVFVTERDPLERLASYFQVRHLRLLRSRFDPARDVFADLRGLQSLFDASAARQVTRQRLWYRRTLVNHFGLDILETRPTGQGLFVARNGSNTLVIVPTHRLNHLREALCAEFGDDAYGFLHHNSATTRGDAALDRAFRRDISIDPAIAKALLEIPEVAHIHRHA